MQVRSVEHTTKYPIRTGIICVEECLIGYSIGHEPNIQEKEEEENVLHLKEGKRAHQCMVLLYKTLSFQLDLQRIHGLTSHYIRMKHTEVYWSVSVMCVLCIGSFVTCVEDDCRLLQI